jgi:hypothetical protein
VVPVAHLIGRGGEQLGDVDGPRVAGAGAQMHQHHQRDHDRAGPVTDPPQADGKPLGGDHQLQRHHRNGGPGHLAEQGQLGAGEHVGAGDAAGGEDGGTRTGHVRGLDIVADQLQGIVGLDAGGDVESAVVEQRPAAMRALDTAQIDADLALQVGLDAVQEVFQQDVFGRNGGVGLQFEDPMAVGLLAAEQRIARPGHGVGQLVERH